MNVLLVIDMQNDFINGALGTVEANLIVENIINKIENFDGEIIFTRDTHQKDYLKTMEGINLPVEHCIKGTYGWEICSQLSGFSLKSTIIDKISFASIYLPDKVKELMNRESQEQKDLVLTLVGLCTDVCVLSNAIILRAFFPEAKIIVDAICCAGVTVESHKNALNAMKMCYVIIVNEEEIYDKD